MSRLRGPLASRNYRLLVACDVTAMLGSSMAAVAIPFAVLGIGGSAADVGYVLAAGLVPTAAFLLLVALYHVVNHGTHHRGQVSGFLRTLGRTPPVIDLAYFYRRR